MKSYTNWMMFCFPMKNIKLLTRIKFSLVAFFLCMMAMLLFFNRDEIFWEMLKKKNCDVAVYDFAGKNAMPFVARFFYKGSKNEFLISKLAKMKRSLPNSWAGRYRKAIWHGAFGAATP